VTVQGARNHVTKIDRRVDPRGRPYFWIEEAEYAWHPRDGSDYEAINEGFISITPLQPDLTSHSALAVTKALTNGLTPHA
jgi:5'-nucleotidase